MTSHYRPTAKSDLDPSNLSPEEELQMVFNAAMQQSQRQAIADLKNTWYKFSPHNPERMRYLIPETITEPFRHPVQAGKWLGIYISIGIIAASTITGLTVTLMLATNKGQSAVRVEKNPNASYFVPTFNYEDY
jgi:hypothetical protein